MNSQPAISEWKFSVDEVIFFRGTVHLTGWSLCPGRRIVEISVQIGDGPLIPVEGYGRPSPDVANALGEEFGACRFSAVIAMESAQSIDSLKLVFILDDGGHCEIANLTHRLDHDPYHMLQRYFFAELGKLPAGAALEIGSRNRSGNVRRDLLPPGFSYVGMDILPGDNVDIIGDAHALSGMFPPESFDAIFSMSVFEHLLMPWKAVLELGKVLKVGGLVLITTHHTFPLHETPWDFFRFSDQSWHGLFNEFSGFEIVQTALGEPASVVPHLMHKTMIGLEGCPAFIGSAVLARKTGDSALRWDVDVKKVVDTMYPQ